MLSVGDRVACTTETPDSGLQTSRGTVEEIRYGNRSGAVVQSLIRIRFDGPEGPGGTWFPVDRCWNLKVANDE